MVIVGGGLVGASLGIALAKLSLRIALIEAIPFTAREQPSYDDRPTALALGSQRIFEGWGLWQDLGSSAAPIRRVHVSEVGRFGVTRLHAEEYGVPALGYVVENRRIGETLAAGLGAASNIETFLPARFLGLRQAAKRVEVDIEHEGASKTLTARLLVGADGANSRVREALGIRAETRDYAQTAVIANVTPERDHRGVAYERFTPSGPIALLPMTPVDREPRCKLVWTHPSTDAAARLKQSETAFLRDLQQAFGHRLGRFRKVGTRASYPLQRVLSQEQTQGRCLLIGNAAHSLHPVAAQGFNLSLRDVVTLTELLAEAIQQQKDIGSAELLTRYCSLRSKDQARVSGFTDSLVRFFSSDLPGLGSARSLGLLGMDLAPALKRAFALRNMGLTASSSSRERAHKKIPSPLRGEG
ncbi:MAG: 2-octaprenyl-6-methoxyphenyl hydroxylase [Nevskiales bacterium]